jgi:DNA polymerase III subunit delta
MADLKPVYLVHGEDHGAIAERRAGLRALAEREGGADCVQALSDEDATPAGVANALAAMTLALGRRVILVDGVERWREGDVREQLTPALQRMPPDTTLALFAREEGRSRAPKAVHEAVKRAGGQIVAQGTVKPWELPKWVRAQGARLGLELDIPAAKAFVAQVGERQQRLLRELEKLALEREPPCAVGAQEIEARAARSAEQRGYFLADALLGAGGAQATRTYVQLRAQGERLPGLIYLMAARLREALSVTHRLQAGESQAEVRRTLRMPPRAAERFLADVARTEPERLRVALTLLADLELDTRGGSSMPKERTRRSSLSEDTLALRLIESIADGR